MKNLLNIAVSHTKREFGDEELGALLAVRNGASPLVLVSKNVKPVNTIVFLETLDAKGLFLEAGKNYLLRGEKVKVLREEFGCGNFLDCYYRVFYLGGDLEEQSTVVKVKYRGGPFGEVIYQSKFEPIQVQEEKNER